MTGSAFGPGVDRDRATRAYIRDAADIMLAQVEALEADYVAATTRAKAEEALAELELVEAGMAERSPEFRKARDDAARRAEVVARRSGQPSAATRKAAKARKARRKRGGPR